MKKTVLTFILAGLLVWLPIAAKATGIAIVTDLQGKAILLHQGRSSAASIASEIEVGAFVLLSKNAVMVVLYFDGGPEYVLSGPAQVTIGASQPEVIGDAPAVRRKPDTGPLLPRIKTVGVAQAALVMRLDGGGGIGSGEIQRPTVVARLLPSIRPLSLLSASGTLVLETQPEFRWREPRPGLKYEVEIADNTGHRLHDALVDGTTLRLPWYLQLREGMTYSWSVSTRLLADGVKYFAAGRFSVANADLRAQAQALRPALDASVASRVVYALWLDQVELKDEARKSWIVLAAERPDDQGLKRLAQR